MDNVVGELDFGLSSNGDAVRLYTDQGELHDEVYFLPDHPWPPEANGQGPSLELISPDLDNSIPRSWKTYTGYGTPGRINNSATYTTEHFLAPFIKVFPNPFTNNLEIKIESSAWLFH